MDASTVVGLVGALGIGSIAGQWVNGRSVRREARARVLTALAETERTRWLAKSDEFMAARHVLRTAGLIAQVPRKAIDVYIDLAESAVAQLQGDIEEGSAYDPRYTLPADITLAVLFCAELVSRCVWRPAIAKVVFRLWYKKTRAHIGRESPYWKAFT